MKNLTTPYKFIGLDLAWSARHNTAGAVIEITADDATPHLTVWREELGDNDDIVRWLQTVAPAPGPALLAIDAPLVVPNQTGARLGDKLLTQVFRKFQAGTHPANRTNLGRYGQPVGDIRGETLAARLVAEAGFSHDPQVAFQTPTRQLFECYPHPAMVVFFELATTLKYKRKLRSVANDRHAAYATFQQHLTELAQADPPLRLPPDLLTRDTRLLRGETLKHYEDLLDSIICAYIALYYWWWGPARTHIFGDLTTGYIVAPLNGDLRRAIPEKPYPGESVI